MKCGHCDRTYPEGYDGLNCVGCGAALEHPQRREPDLSVDEIKRFVFGPPATRTNFNPDEDWARSRYLRATAPYGGDYE